MINLVKPGEFMKFFNQMVFSILFTGHRKCDERWNKTARKFMFHSMWMIVKGRGDLIIDGTHYTAEPGKMFMIVPGMLLEQKTDPEDPLEYYFIRFKFALAYDSDDHWHFEDGSHLEFPLSGMYKIENPPPIINLYEQIYHLWQRRGQIVTMRRKILFQELLLSIVQDFRTQKIAGNTTMAIEMTIDHLVQHYKEDLKLDELAKIAGLSVSHYSRLFKKYTSYSPIDYLTHIRMDRAKELLALSDYRLKGVAQSVGYQDEFYFSRIFKKVVGVSPSDYARKHKLKQI
jgi:AraC-like DNA-binding protein